VIFAFFGYPGAGKSTLVERFARLHGIPGIDTDRFMSDLERAAVLEARYTQAMRLANIDRYCAYLCATVPAGGHAALADGLPNNEARRYLAARFSPSRVLLVHVNADPQVWAGRLAAREHNPVAVGVAEAKAYIAASWEPIDPGLEHVVVDNGADEAVLKRRLEQIFALATAKAAR
jgi:predicted kinase